MNMQGHDKQKLKEKPRRQQVVNKEVILQLIFCLFLYRKVLLGLFKQIKICDFRGIFIALIFLGGQENFIIKICNHS